MDSLSAVSPSIMVPPHPTTPLHRHHTLSPSLPHNHLLPFRLSAKFQLSRSRTRRRIPDWVLRGSLTPASGAEPDGVDEERDGDVEVERALRLDGTIPGTSDEFVKQVSSRAYDIRRHLHQSIDSSSYDVLEANPWRDSSKPVYVLTQKENQLCTMKTRRNFSEVERELGLLFSKGRKRAADMSNQNKQSRTGKKFQMVVEDVREGILVFEDQNDAARYCDLLQGGGQGCEGVAEIEASSVFDLCRNSRALAVLFRRGRTPPQPENLQLKLRARKQSLED